MKRIVKRFFILCIILLPIFLNARHNARVKPYPELKIFSYEIQGDTHWLGMGKGIVKYDAVTDSVLHITEAVGYELGIVKDIAVVDSNLVWFVANDSLLLSYDGKKWIGQNLELNKNVVGKIRGITINKHGTLWLVIEQNIVKLENNVWRLISDEVPLKNPIKDLIFYKDVLWIRTYNEIAAYRHNNWDYLYFKDEYNNEQKSYDFIVKNDSLLFTTAERLNHLKFESEIIITTAIDQFWHKTVLNYDKQHNLWFAEGGQDYMTDSDVIMVEDGNENKKGSIWYSERDLAVIYNLNFDFKDQLWLTTSGYLYKLTDDGIKNVKIWRDPLDYLMSDFGEYWDLQGFYDEGPRVKGEGNLIDSQEEGYWVYRIHENAHYYSDPKSYPYKEGNFKNGLKVGTWLQHEFRRNNKKIRNYSNGYLEGETLIFNKDGSLKSKENYKHNKKHGEFINYHKNDCYQKAVYEMGKLFQDWEYYNSNDEMIYSLKNPELLKTPELKEGEKKNGFHITLLDKHLKPVSNYADAKFYREATYKDDKPVGIVRDYYINGQLQFEGRLHNEFPYKHDGKVKFYSIMGKLIAENNYVNGVKHGFCTTYMNRGFKSVRTYESAKYYREANYKNGKPVGVVKDYFLNGMLQFEGEMLSEFPSVYDGVIKIYGKNGKLKNIRDYDKGDEIATYMRNGKVTNENAKDPLKLKWSGKRNGKKKDGLWTLTEDGKPIDFNYYIDGEEQKPLKAIITLPVNWLRNLRYYEMKPVIVEFTNTGKWKLRDNLKMLMSKIKSPKEVSVVVRPDCKNWPKGITSTEGREAMYMIEGFIQGIYPPTESSFTDFDPDPEYYQKWWLVYLEKRK